MKRVELLVVERTSCLGTGANGKPTILIIRPNFAVPSKGWKEREENVTIIRPDGKEFDATAQISLSHINFTDPNVPIEQRWRVNVWFKEKISEDVPIGSKILVSHETRDVLLAKGLPNPSTMP